MLHYAKSYQRSIERLRPVRGRKSIFEARLLRRELRSLDLDCRKTAQSRARRTP